jgi:hypothetical protein
VQTVRSWGGSAWGGSACGGHGSVALAMHCGPSAWAGPSRSAPPTALMIVSTLAATITASWANFSLFLLLFGSASCRPSRRASANLKPCGRAGDSCRPGSPLRRFAPRSSSSNCALASASSRRRRSTSDSSARAALSRHAASSPRQLRDQARRVPLSALVGRVMFACSASFVTASCSVVTVMGSMTPPPGMRWDSSVLWRDQTPL